VNDALHYVEPPAMRSRRLARCTGCALPEALCLCGELPRIETRTRVVIVTHRNELAKSTNTARIAARLLTRSEVHVRGVLDPSAPPPVRRRAGVAAPARPRPDPAAPGPGTERRLVLFPSDGARALCADDALGSLPLVLLVPDGSWSQASKSLRRVPLLAGVEPVALPALAPSRYKLRRNQREGGLCTLEAIARALGVLEGAEVEAELLHALDCFVVRALETRGRRGSP